MSNKLETTNAGDQRSTKQTNTNIITRFLREPGIWVPITCLIAILTLWVSILNIPKKELTVIREQPEPLVELNPETEGNIEIRYNGRIANDPTLIRLHVENTGNQPIEESDYSKNISFEFNPNIEIIDYAVVEQRPSNIGMVLTQTTSYKVEIIPTLLNENDTATIRIIAINSTNQEELRNFKVDARIKDVQQIREQTPEDQNRTNSSIEIMAALYPFITIPMTLMSFILGFYYHGKLRHSNNE